MTAATSDQTQPRADRAPFRISLANAQRYLLALIMVGIVIVIRLGIARIDPDLAHPYLLFPLAILISAWVGGFGPGILATVIATVAIDYFFLEPYYSLGLEHPAQWIAQSVNFVQGLIISGLAGSKRRLMGLLQQSRDELEQRVIQRTDQLRASNAALEGQIEENHRTLEELRTQAIQLERSNRELQDFASVASHDLQEPLRKIQAFGDRLRVKCAPAFTEEGRDYLDRMHNAASRMQVLINDLLSFSRVTTRAQPFAPVDLGMVVRDVLTDLETRIEQLGARVEVQELPTIDADALQMRQLVQNLVSNGLKFHKPDVPPVVRIWSRPAPTKEQEMVQLLIEDNGIGFDEKYLDRIFSIFQRLHGRGTYEGTGIGLAVCRKIAERHGGTITAHSTPGQGSTFIVQLPVRHDSTLTDRPVGLSRLSEEITA
jgi:signal transduction histidine kinase